MSRRRHTTLRAALLAATLVTATLAATLATATAARADERLVEHVWQADEVVRIDGRVGVQATIGFGEEERIENVAVGDSQAWQITPNKRANLLFVKPLDGGARTNMTVVTDRRTYFFDLVASSKTSPVYFLRFRYPDDERQAAAAAADSQAAPSLNDAEQSLLAGDAAAQPADPAMLNFAWGRSGDVALLPARIYDDGRATYLLWSTAATMPAILVENEQGDEGPVNYAVRGSTIVLDDVPGRIVLRAGKARATLVNLRAGRAVPEGSGAGSASGTGATAAGTVSSAPALLPLPAPPIPSQGNS